VTRETIDLAIVGAGAAGLFAAIWAGRRALESRGGPTPHAPVAPSSVIRAEHASRLRVVALDGAKKLGAKILVAGGGRCNVTHWRLDERDFNGSTPGAIRRVLARFGVAETTEFFRELGVELKREATGKLFPVTDDAHTVLDALLGEVRRVGVELRHPARVHEVRACGHAGEPRFEIDFDGGTVAARRVIIAAGGRALPKSGSDGAGFELAKSLGHTITPLVTAALVPLLLREGHWVRAIPGVAAPAEAVVRDSGKIVGRFAGDVLCTHFGLSGPAILDASRHWLHVADGSLSVRWLPDIPDERLDAWLLEGAGGSILAHLRNRLPENFARAVLGAVEIDPAVSPRQLPRERRARLAAELGPAPLPVTGDRGDTFAEATAGGVPLREFRLETLESRNVPGLHFCGEVLDVDGRIGGFNFQWAWASGFIAGRAAAEALLQTSSDAPPSNIEGRSTR